MLLVQFICPKVGSSPLWCITIHSISKLMSLISSNSTINDDSRITVLRSCRNNQDWKTDFIHHTSTQEFFFHESFIFWFCFSFITLLHQPKFNFVSANFFSLSNFSFSIPKGFSLKLFLSYHFQYKYCDNWNCQSYFVWWSLKYSEILQTFFLTYNFLICIVNNILNLALTKNKIACFNVQDQAQFDQRVVFRFCTLRLCSKKEYPYWAPH